MQTIREQIAETLKQYKAARALLMSADHAELERHAFNVSLILSSATQHVKGCNRLLKDADRYNRPDFESMALQSAQAALKTIEAAKTPDDEQLEAAHAKAQAMANETGRTCYILPATGTPEGYRIANANAGQFADAIKNAALAAYSPAPGFYAVHAGNAAPTPGSDYKNGVDYRFQNGDVIAVYRTRYADGGERTARLMNECSDPARLRSEITSAAYSTLNHIMSAQYPHAAEIAALIINDRAAAARSASSPDAHALTLAAEDAAAIAASARHQAEKLEEQHAEARRALNARARVAPELLADAAKFGADAPTTPAAQIDALTPADFAEFAQFDRTPQERAAAILEHQANARHAEAQARTARKDNDEELARAFDYQAQGQRAIADAMQNDGGPVVLMPYPEDAHTEKDSARFFVRDANGKTGYPQYVGIYKTTRTTMNGTREEAGKPYIFAGCLVIDTQGGNGRKSGETILNDGQRVQIGDYYATIKAPGGYSGDSCRLTDIEPVTTPEPPTGGNLVDEIQQQPEQQQQTRDAEAQQVEAPAPKFSPLFFLSGPVPGWNHAHGVSYRFTTGETVPVYGTRYEKSAGHFIRLCAACNSRERLAYEVTEAAYTISHENGAEMTRQAQQLGARIAADVFGPADPNDDNDDTQPGNFEEVLPEDDQAGPDDYTPTEGTARDVDAPEGAAAAMQEMPRAYTVAACRLPRITRKIDALARKAAKIGQVIELREISRERRPIQFEGGPGIIETFGEFVTVEIIGFDPVIAGWQFVGVIEHHSTGNIYRTRAGHSIPEEFRHRPQYCDHCHTARRRNNTYAVQHVETGAFKQVGADCLRDFLGGNDPGAYVAFFEMCAEMEAEHDTEPEGEPFPEGGGGLEFDTREVLELAASAARQFGWVSAAQAKAEAGWPGGKQGTADRVIENILRRHRLNKNDVIEGQPGAGEEARAALSWARAEEREGSKSEYVRNLHYIAVRDHVDIKNTAFLVSAIGAYRRHVEGELKRSRERAEQPARAHVGTEGKREAFTVQVVNVREFESNYGVTVLHTFADRAGNVLKWWSSSTQLEQGEILQVRATVKEHGEYQGTPETTITRAKVEASYGFTEWPAEQPAAPEKPRRTRKATTTPAAPVQVEEQPAPVDDDSADAAELDALADIAAEQAAQQVENLQRIARENREAADTCEWDAHHAEAAGNHRNAASARNAARELRESAARCDVLINDATEAPPRVEIAPDDQTPANVPASATAPKEEGKTAGYLEGAEMWQSRPVLRVYGFTARMIQCSPAAPRYAALKNATPGSFSIMGDGTGKTILAIPNTDQEHADAITRAIAEHAPAPTAAAAPTALGWVYVIVPPDAVETPAATPLQRRFSVLWFVEFRTPGAAWQELPDTAGESYREAADEIAALRLCQPAPDRPGYEYRLNAMIV